MDNKKQFLDRKGLTLPVVVAWSPWTGRVGNMTTYLVYSTSFDRCQQATKRRLRTSQSSAAVEHTCCGCT